MRIKHMRIESYKSNIILVEENFFKWEMIRAKTFNK